MMTSGTARDRIKQDDMIAVIDQLERDDIDALVDWQMSSSQAARVERGSAVPPSPSGCVPSPVGRAHALIMRMRDALAELGVL